MRDTGRYFVGRVATGNFNILGNAQPVTSERLTAAVMAGRSRVVGRCNIEFLEARELVEAALKVLAREEDA